MSKTVNLTEAEKYRLEMITKLSVAAMRGVTDYSGWKYKTLGEIVQTNERIVDRLYDELMSKRARN